LNSVTTTPLIRSQGIRRMSKARIETEILNFLTTDTPEVLCIRGNWGTGKTFTWDDILKKNKLAIKLKKYAYVSLFGLDSISKVRLQMFHSTIATTHIGKEFNTADVEASLREGWSWGKRLMTLAGKVFSDADSVEVALSLVAMSARKQIVCFDDLERKGEGLRSADVLGLISELKERRDCKVVLLLNDEQLEDRDEFEGFLEKVVDINLSFRPTAAESAAIALNIDGDKVLKKLVRNRATALGIDNVRVIRKIFRLVKMIDEQLKSYSPEILKNVVSSLVLFGWSHYQPELAPPLGFLRNNRSEWAAIRDKDKVTDEERAWGVLLDEYGYGYTDKFDLVLMNGVKDGYFHEDAVAEHAAELHEREDRNAADQELREAWDNYNYSFKTSAEEIMDRLYEQFMKKIEFYSFSNLISLVNLFRDLDDPKRAQEMVDAFIAVKKDIKGVYDMSSLYSYGREVPVDLIPVFEAAENAQKPTYGFEEMLLKLKSDGYNEDINTKLAAADAIEYYRVFKNNEGSDNLGEILRGVSQYLRVQGLNQYAQAIMDKAGEALRMIAKESVVNDRRARSWGLIQRLEQKEAEAAVAAATTAPAATGLTAPVEVKPKRRSRAKAAE
jgi:hypothetical protein